MRDRLLVTEHNRPKNRERFQIFNPSGWVLQVVLMPGLEFMCGIFAGRDHVYVANDRHHIYALPLCACAPPQDLSAER